jgi:hypothetical protein
MPAGGGGGAAPTCATGLGCIMNKCTTCGGKDQACCPGGGGMGGGGATRCDTGLSCSTDKCVSCGNPGDICCPAVGGGGGPANDGCTGPENNCVMGMCVGTLCGTEGQACCDAPDGSMGNGCPATITATLKCINDKCAACGQLDEPCCVPGGPGGDGCIPTNLMCMGGTCKMM